MTPIKLDYRLAERILLAIVYLSSFYLIFERNELPHFARQSEAALPIVSAISGISVSLLGFMLAVTIFLLGLTEIKTFSILRASSSYREFWSVFKGGIFSSSACSLVCLLSILSLWITDYPRWLAWLLVCSAAWMTFKVIRVAWLLKLILDAEIAQGQQSRKAIRG